MLPLHLRLSPRQAELRGQEASWHSCWAPDCEFVEQTQGGKECQAGGRESAETDVIALSLRTERGL